MNQVTYEVPAPARRRVLLALELAAVVAVVLVAAVMWLGLGDHVVTVLSLLAGSGILFGVNTVTYETPVSGVVAPTAAQSFNHEQVSAVITGDGAATTFVVTHNWGLSAAELAAGWAEVELEYLLAAGYTAAALISSKTANDVQFTCTAFTGAGVRVRVKRPHTITR